MMRRKEAKKEEREGGRRVASSLHTREREKEQLMEWEGRRRNAFLGFSRLEIAISQIPN